MTTNTYTNLCDSVGAWVEKCPKLECIGNPLTVCHTKGNEHCPLYSQPTYPPQSAEQRERLEELILDLGRLSYHKSDIYYICILSRVNNANNGMAGTRPDALYALTQKLVAEGILSKEEVKEVLNG